MCYISAAAARLASLVSSLCRAACSPQTGPRHTSQAGPSHASSQQPAARPLADNTPHSDSQQQPRHRELRGRGSRHSAVQHRGRGLALHRITGTGGPGLRQFTPLFRLMCIYSLHVPGSSTPWLGYPIFGLWLATRRRHCSYCSRQITLLHAAHSPLQLQSVTYNT